MKLWRKIVIGFFSAYLLLAAVVWVVVSLPPARFAAIVANLPTSEKPGLLFMIVPIGPLMMLARAGHLKPGDVAPDFRLPLLHSQETVELASYRGQKPVALVFGSYT
jgi:hypothetical protein